MPNNEENILQGIRAYHIPGDIIELRVPDANGSAVSGYFNDLTKLARAAGIISEMRCFPGVYITLNPVRPNLLDRVGNTTERRNAKTKDEDIAELRWLPIDIDAERPKGSSSSDSEHAVAIERARAIKSLLVQRGWPEDAFVFVDSGNGAHLPARILLENTNENVELIKRCLQALDLVFSDGACKVDTSTFNPSRIWKLPGTWVCKGKNTPDRPHRIAKILEAPEDLQIIPRELLFDLAEMAPKEERCSGTSKGFDPAKFAEDHGARVRKVKDWNGWKLAILEECPFDSSHNRGEAYLGVHSNGAIDFKCWHNSCRNNDWSALKKLWNVSKATENDTEPQKASYSDKVKVVGDRIMEYGDVLKFLVQQAQRNHIGDEDVIKHLFASAASTNSRTSAGIQPAINGEKGHGKTDCAKSVFHILPDEWKMAASVSAKTPYYLPMKDGLVIFSDDVEWSPDLIHTLKRAMGNFQERQTHQTINKKGEPVPKIMAARLVWWLSSVESVADDQLIDRQYSLDIDEGPEHAQEVSTYLKNGRAKKVVRYSVDWRIEVARYIIQQIKDHEPFDVVTPCADVADWKISGDHRMQNKFWDLVEAFAIIRHRQRYVDEDGWLYASVEDFNEAKAIFMRRKANHRTHLSNPQTIVVKAVIALQDSSGGATQANIAAKLGKSQQAISKALTAIKANTPFVVSSKGPNGEEQYKATVPALEIAFREGDIVTLPEDYKDPYNHSQPPYNRVTTNHTTTKTDSSNNKTTSIQLNNQENNMMNIEEGEAEESPLSVLGENGCMAENCSEAYRKAGCEDGCKGVVAEPIEPDDSEFSPDEENALSQTLTRMKRRRMHITPFSLADMVREHFEIPPRRCRTWLKRQGWTEHPGSGWQEASA